MKTHKLFFLVFCFAITNLAFSQSGIQNVCLSPVDQHVDVTSTNSANFIWSLRHGASAWDIEVGEVGFEPGQGDFISRYKVRQSAPSISTKVEFTMRGLEPGTVYNVFIRTNCGGGDFSEWSKPVTFTTKSL
ncbi:MAG: fibronectin type III domain-containing protein [Bacteroidetes bacterium]|nr:fibronectin type III domain-containing protein [Bacteroidota bacterium]MBL7103467.1 fibronectin type III domain-containing protein [Bacteroidales bacterium]